MLTIHLRHEINVTPSKKIIQQFPNTIQNLSVYLRYKRENKFNY